MKSKNFSKKLMLNKKTIAHLDNKEMKVAHGGTGDTEEPGCAVPGTLTECPIPNITNPCYPTTFGQYSCPTACYTLIPGQACNVWFC